MHLFIYLAFNTSFLSTSTMSPFTDVLDSQFGAKIPNEAYTLLKHLKAAYPTQHHITHSGDGDESFPVQAYLTSIDVPFAEVKDDGTTDISYWDFTQKKVSSTTQNGIFTFTHDGVDYTLFTISWTLNYDLFSLTDLVFSAESDEPGKKLAAEVYSWANSLKDEIWVFQHGHWSKNKELHKAIKAANWDDIVLEKAFLDSLRRDTETFFASEETYTQLGAAWKRGILLLGMY